MKQETNVIRTNLGDVLEAVGTRDATYNEQVVNLLSDQQVLARILKSTVEECADMELEALMEAIDEPQIRSVRVEPGLTNLGKIEGVNTADIVQNEGAIFFDIRFNALLKHLNVKILFNVEPQRMWREPELNYPIENRMVFYLARIVSAQKGTEFQGSNYQGMKKSVTIWIIPLPESAEDGVIESLDMVPRTVYGKSTGLLKGGLMQGILIGFRKGRNFEESRNELIRFLEELLGTDPFQIKKEKLEKEHNVVMSVELEGRMERMCDYASLIREEGREEGREVGIKNSIMICKKGGIDKDTSIKLIEEQFLLTHSEAEKRMFLYWKD